MVEGGGAIRGSYLHIEATDLTVDDGGAIDVSNGGHSPNQGPSKKAKLDIIIEIVFKSFLYEFVWKCIIFMINRLSITIC